MHTIQTPMTLLEALQHYYPDSSRRTLQQWIQFGRVKVNDEVVTKATHSLEEGQILTLHSKEKPETTIQGIPILYQDRWMVVIDKPVGLLSVATDNPEKIHALALLRQHFQISSIFAVHRIDRDTSGVLLFARGTLAQERFDKMFEEHSLEREYLAVVEGRMAQDEGTWQSYLFEKENYDVVTSTADKGRLAISHFSVYRRSKLFSYLRLKLETGRKHQIRVHCKEAGHPILGDVRYGSTMDPLKRLCLHAHALRFKHPFTGQWMDFTSPLPKTFDKIGASIQTQPVPYLT